MLTKPGLIKSQKSSTLKSALTRVSADVGLPLMAGTFSGEAGATSSSTCSACPAGTFSLMHGVALDHFDVLANCCGTSMQDMFHRQPTHEQALLLHFCDNIMNVLANM